MLSAYETQHIGGRYRDAFNSPSEVRATESDEVDSRIATLECPIGERISKPWMHCQCARCVNAVCAGGRHNPIRELSGVQSRAHSGKPELAPYGQIMLRRERPSLWMQLEPHISIVICNDRRRRIRARIIMLESTFLFETLHELRQEPVAICRPAIERPADTVEYSAIW